MNKYQTKIAIVLPAFNEQLSLGDLLNELVSSFSNQVEIVVVDDGSIDSTFDVALKYTDFVLRHVVNLGKGAALRTGCRFAFSKLNADYVIMMDADRQHAVSDLFKFIEKIHEGDSLIFGVRSLKKMPKAVAFTNKVTSLILKIVYGVYIPDILSGYKALSKEMYEHFNWQAVGYEIEIELAKKVAKERILFITLPIETIYLNYVKGVSFIDAVRVWVSLFGIK